MKKTLYVASKNHGKINEYQRMLFNVNCQLLSQPESIEVIEDGLSFEENAMKKACEVAKRTNSFSIADDSGLCIDSLDGRPGIFSSRYAENDLKRIQRVLSELDGKKNREAYFVAHICVASPEGKVVLNSEGRCYGNILHKPRGDDGFGYDPIFQEVSSALSFAEMGYELKKQFSHRGRALEKIIPDLVKIFN
tara:strand:+ start:1288 stop:1866 length:579 start_codon:yes stop_codon:yes gene_type:complete